MLIYRFRNCLLNTIERSVIKGDQHVDLTTRTFDVLLHLVENAGKVVTKDEILGMVWTGNFVEESNLPVHISKLRRSLGETRAERYIETVQGVGYRFVAPVKDCCTDEWTLVASQSRQTETRSKQGNPRSIAVLPFTNECQDPNAEYIVDGLAEGLINHLSCLQDLKVIARDTVFRFKNRTKNGVEIGHTLGVSHILTGHVRASEKALQIYCELIKIDEGTQSWGSTYQRPIGDVLLLQEEIAAAVIENLASRSKTTTSAGNALTRDPESYRLYLKARYHLEKHSAADIYLATELLEQSVSRDPENIHARTEIVECYRALYTYDYITYVEFLELCKPAIDSIKLQNQDVDVVQIMYCDLKMMQWRFAEAEEFCGRGLALNPSSLKGRLRYADLLMQKRDFVAALEQLELVMNIDPLSPLIYKRIGRAFYAMEDYDNAIAYLDDALDLEPLSHEALSIRGSVYLDIGNHASALRDFTASLQSEYHPETLAMMGVVYAKQGFSGRARAMIKRLQSEDNGQSAIWTSLAHIYISLEKLDETFDCLSRALENHEPDMRALTYDPRWVSIRSDQRFKGMVLQVGLPAF